MLAVSCLLWCGYFWCSWQCQWQLLMKIWITLLRSEVALDCQCVTCYHIFAFLSQCSTFIINGVCSSQWKWAIWPLWLCNRWNLACVIVSINRPQITFSSLNPPTTRPVKHRFSLSAPKCVSMVVHITAQGLPSPKWPILCLVGR